MPVVQLGRAVIDFLSQFGEAAAAAVAVPAAGDDGRHLEITWHKQNLVLVEISSNALGGGPFRKDTSNKYLPIRFVSFG